MVLAVCMLLAAAARAENVLLPIPAVPDAVYKGVLGMALDAVPMDPERRVALQRTNAVVSNTLTGRSLSVWVGLATNPLLLIAGLAWGVFAASNIKTNDASAQVETRRHEPLERFELGHDAVALGPAW